MTQLERQELTSRIGAMSKEEKEFVAELLGPSIMISELDRVFKRYESIEKEVLGVYGIKKKEAVVKNECTPAGFGWRSVLTDPPKKFVDCIFLGRRGDVKVAVSGYRGDSGDFITDFINQEKDECVISECILMKDLNFEPEKWMGTEEFARKTGLVIESGVTV